MTDLIGKTLGQYQIVRELGRGGMAIVYEAYQPSLSRTIAIKVLPPQFAADKAFVQRFLLEARAAARLEHPNIVAVHDVAEDQGIYYIVMQKLEGESLQALLRRTGRLPLERAVRIVAQVAAALAYAHAAGIVHRDIKPANIIVGPRDHAWLTDFGIAKAITGGIQVTQTGAVVGTPEYMSPEQARGKPVGPTSDIYALGIVLYQALAGRPPFEADAAHVILYKHVFEAPPPVRARLPELSAEVDVILAKALAKDPEQRFQSAEEMRQALIVLVQNAPTRQKSIRAGGQGKPWIGIAIGGAVLVMVLVLFLSAIAAPAAAPTSTRPAILIPPSTVTLGSGTATTAPALPTASASAPVPTRLPTQTPSGGIPATATLAPRPTSTAVRLPTTAPTANPWGSLRIYRPTQADAESMQNLWKDRYKDLLAPGTQTYDVAVRPSDVWRWGFSWHAKDTATLREILKPLSVELLVNGVLVPDALVLIHDDAAPDHGWWGHRWVMGITDWPSGQKVVLEVRYRLVQRVYDGQNYIEPGEYRQIIYASVQ